MLLNTISVFFISLCSLYLLIPLARRWGLVDHPDQRKQHEGSPPLVGGVAIVFAFTLGCVFQFQNLTSFVVLLLLASLVIFGMGLLDDLKQLPVKLRVLIIIGISLLLMFFSGMYLKDLGNLLLLGNLHLVWLGVPFTLIAILGVSNGFNMLDGIDGLAASLAIVTLLGIILFAQMHQVVFTELFFLVLLISAMIPFLLCNLKLLPLDKVFLGDSGALFLGFFLTWLLIGVTQVDATQAWLKPENALWCAALPIMDTVYSMYRRKRAGLSYFEPDRGHVHHILLDLGLSARKTLFVLVGLALFFLSFGLAWEYWVGKGAFYIFFALYIVYTQLMKKAKQIIEKN